MSNRYYTYVLRHPITGEAIYVGKGTGNRMYQHWRCRNMASYHNVWLQRTLKVLESQGLTPLYEKIINGVTEQEALQKEMELIAVYGRRDLHNGPLLNFTNGGEAGASSWSPETRERRKQSELAKCKGRPVTQYNMEGEKLLEFSSAKVAAEQVRSANRSYITQCCKGNRVSSGGFLWAYVGDPIPSYQKKYWREVIQQTLDGVTIATYPSLTHAQEATGIELHNISECCRGKSKTAGGYQWAYT